MRNTNIPARFALDTTTLPIDFRNGNVVSKDINAVVRVAIRNTASVAALLITTEAMVTEEPKKSAGAGMPLGGGMGDLGGMTS